MATPCREKRSRSSSGRLRRPASTRTARASGRRRPAPGPPARPSPPSGCRLDRVAAGGPRHRRWPGAGSRRASRHRDRSTRAHPRRAAPSCRPPRRRIRPTPASPRSARRCARRSILSRTSIATLIGATRSTGPAAARGRATRRRARALEDPLGVVEHLVDRGPRDLQRPVDSAPGLGLELTLHRPGDIPHPAQGQDQGIRQPRTRPSGSRQGPPRAGRPRTPRRDRSLRLPALRAARIDHAGGQLVGDRRGDPVDELVRLVDDEHARARAASGDPRRSRSP
jgi:hypothetical protein